MEKTREYYEMLSALGFAELEPIPQDELNELLEKVDSGEKFPPSVCIIGNQYDRYVEKDCSEEEFKKVFMLKMLEKINTIKNGVLFFVVLSVISLVLSLISLVSLLQ